MWYDATRKRIYVPSGAGFTYCYQQIDADHYRLLSTIPTVAGARTSLFVPDAGRLYLAVPHGPDHEAQVFEYRVGP